MSPSLAGICIIIVYKYDIFLQWTKINLTLKMRTVIRRGDKIGKIFNTAYSICVFSTISSH